MKQLSLKAIALAFIVLLAATGALIVSAEYITLNNVRGIEAKWMTFQAGRSEKVRAVNALRRELGYGGIIHSFKNYVLRKDAGLKRIADTKLGGARAIIAQYRSLGVGAIEEKALTDIAGVLDAYAGALATAERLIGRGESPGAIDRAVKVDDGPALTGLNALDSQLTQQRKLITSIRNKPLFISDFRRAIGYGGMIHNFKNFVLRHDHALLQPIKTGMAAAFRALDGYQALGVNSAERQALTSIRSTVAAYRSNLAIADRLADTGAKPVEIDRAVRIDDGPALRGLETLNREIIAANDRDARLVSESLGLVAGVAVFAAWITAVLILFLIAASLWLIRGRIVGAITRMTALMTRLAEGDLNVPFRETSQINEIGAMENALKVFRDTATDRLEQAQRFQLVLDNAVDGIVTANDQGIIEMFNPAAEQMFGYNADEMIGGSLDMLMPESMPGNHVQFIGDYLDTGIAKIIGSKRELEGRHKDGTIFPIELAVTKLELGGRTLFTGMVSDIRERKQAELTKDQFVSTVSHELRTPLTSIRGSLGLLLGGALSEDAEKTAEMLTLASNNTDRLINLVNDLLDFERLQSDQMKFDFQPLELGALVEQAIEINRPYAAQLDVAIDYEGAGAKARIIGDPDRLNQVLSNFLSNGAKFSPAGGTLTVTVIVA
ncbi:MAG: PAS domain S-box protein, partial [Rhodospirillales bacterium]|nr:PAS domain S-box protein [Rhodospirillales bacterium]